MPLTLLLTGFGPFPGAPVNPTGPLVRALARRGRHGPGGMRRIAHVFETSYAAVDRELPDLLARARPHALIMFGLAPRTRQIRIETRARNALATTIADASGQLPPTRVISANAAPAIRLRLPAPRLLAAVRSAGLRVALSADAGSYLCNYLSWRASEAAQRGHAPRVVAFVHVPSVRLARTRPARRTRTTHSLAARPRGQRFPITLLDLMQAGEAIVHAALRLPTRRIHR